MIKAIAGLVKEAQGMQIDLICLGLGAVFFLVGTIRSKKWSVSVPNRKRLNFWGPVFLAAGLVLVMLGKFAEMILK